jgi:hypothetical protein
MLNFIKVRIYLFSAILGWANYLASDSGCRRRRAAPPPVTHHLARATYCTRYRKNSLALAGLTGTKLVMTPPVPALVVIAVQAGGCRLDVVSST